MSASTVSAVRLTYRRPLRAPIAAAAGAGLLGLSMLLSVAPVLGAANNGNGNGSNGTGSGGGGQVTSGNVKVHDAGTGLETSGSDNEPHVCAFWLGFTFDAPFEAGTWIVVSWAPTGDGSTVASGVYDTAGDGIDSSGVIDVAAGHYRVEWAATGATSSKKKTFWVDTCNVPAPAEDPVPPTDLPSSPAEESPAEDPVPPTDAPSSPAEETPGEPALDELVLAGEENAPAEEESDSEEATPVDEETPSTNEEVPATDEVDAQESAVEDDTTPTTDPSQPEEPAQPEVAGPTDAGTPPAHDELGSTGGADELAMPDTATPAPVRSGPLAIVGLLLLAIAHVTARRGKERTSHA